MVELVLGGDATPSRRGGGARQWEGSRCGEERGNSLHGIEVVLIRQHSAKAIEADAEPVDVTVRQATTKALWNACQGKEIHQLTPFDGEDLQTEGDKLISRKEKAEPYLDHA